MTRERYKTGRVGRAKAGETPEALRCRACGAVLFAAKAPIHLAACRPALELAFEGGSGNGKGSGAYHCDCGARKAPGRHACDDCLKLEGRPTKRKEAA